MFFKVKKDGTWLSPYGEVVNEEIKRFLLRNLVEENGKFFIKNGEKEVRVEVEDTPFFVEALRERKNPDGSIDLVLLINDGTEEILNPESLEIRPDNSVYCPIKKGKFKAKFTLSAYWQLVEHIVEENGEFYLVLGNKKWRLGK